MDVLAKMDPEKRERLINSAMDEFGKNRFEKASTNVIVKHAGISKGLLFHYFDSKEALYNYLVDFAIELVSKPIAHDIGCKDRDIIHRLKQITELKINIMLRYPSLTQFSKTMFIGKDFEEIKAIIQKHHPVPLEYYYSHNIDTEMFRDGVDVPTAVKTIRYTLEHMSETIVTQRNMGFQPDLESIMQEVNQFLDHFRSIYYKQDL